MITGDQPSIFPGSLIVKVSSRTDGTMLDRSGHTPHKEVLRNRQEFCGQSSVNYDALVHQVITYEEGRTYDRLVEVNQADTYRYKPEGVTADAVFTRTPGVGFFLPVADCVATVIYDPKKHFLGLLHLGRHSTLTDLLPQVIDTFFEAGSTVEDLLVWMSPSAGRQNYRLDWFTKVDEPAWLPFRDVRSDGIYLDMSGFNRKRCIEAGIPADNIQVSPVDTMKSPEYFSHARGDVFGRIAVLAKLI